ncbi:hypothetical protein C8J57DRAFT_1259053 [Mycena rebaudengoi]|nr:hypothetical protein C8J57DRAFT_1259053 [Mycena rebaudengoi]
MSQFTADTAQLILDYWPYADEERPKESTPRGPLPIETWTEIITIYCYTGTDTDGPNFEKSREEMRGVWAEFRKLIDGVPAFWQCLTVDVKTSVSEIEHAKECLATSPVDLLLNLHVATWIGDREENITQHFSRMTSCINTMAAISTQWRNLTIIANNDRFLDLLHNLAPLDVPMLSDVCVFSVAASTHSHDVYKTPFLPDIFQGQLPALISLTALAFAVRWSHRQLFDSLETLELRNIPPSGYPTRTELIDAITSSPSLHTLILDSVGITDTSGPSIQPYTLPSVKLLELNFPPASLDDGKALILLLAVAVLPSITTLKLANAGSEAMSNIATHLDFLHQIRALYLMGCVDPEPSLLQIMHKFENVHSFDASMAIWPATTTFASHPYLLPELEHLVIGPMPILALASYVRERQTNKANRLKTITYHHRTTQPLTKKQRKALDYMISELQSFYSIPDLS